MTNTIAMYGIHLLFIAAFISIVFAVAAAPAAAGLRERADDAPAALLRKLPSTSPERIVGGESIDIAEVPFVLSFRLKGSHACGGAIVSRDWGVTAAHCATAYEVDPWREITIRSGTSYAERGGLLHNITRLEWHEKFDSEYSDYDIAVFKVAPSFEFSDTTRPIKLPPPPPPPPPPPLLPRHRRCLVDASWALAAGWGEFREYESTTSRVLQYVILPKVPRSECASYYAGRYEVTPRQVCYGFRNGGADTCKGDSGGPLVNRHKILIGITSWGDGCAKPRSPGVYTDVILLADWVRAKITTV